MGLIACQSLALLWLVTSPNKLNKLKKTRYFRILYFVGAIVCVTVPAVLSLVQLDEGFEAVGVPVLLCLGRSRRFLYYAFSLPMSLLGTVPSAALVMTGWALLKVNKGLHSTVCL